MLTELNDVYQEVIQSLEKELQYSVKMHPYAAPPGFHIFEDTEDQEASIHIDTPFNKVYWPGQIKVPFSFTVALALPEKAGLNFGEELEFIPYREGYMYLHDGLTTHQIAKPTPSSVESPRITLQGHGAIIGQEGLEQAWIYF